MNERHIYMREYDQMALCQFGPNKFSCSFQDIMLFRFDSISTSVCATDGSGGGGGSADDDDSGSNSSSAADGDGKRYACGNGSIYL